MTATGARGSDGDEARGNESERESDGYGARGSESVRVRERLKVRGNESDRTLCFELSFFVCFLNLVFLSAR